MKKLFGLLTFILIGLINFGYCFDLPQDTWNGNNEISTIDTQFVPDLITHNNQNTVEYNVDMTDIIFYCFRGEGGGQFSYSIDNSNYTAFGSNYMECLSEDTVYINRYAGGSSRIAFYYFKKGDRFMNLNKLTSVQCQTEYNLIPISSVDQNYCVNNGLCPSGGGDCPVCPGSGDNWSALYINDIQHLGKPIINITIPDYITWDYTTNENEFNLYCGSGYDQDYIDSIISINSYRPDSGDFTNIFVSGLTLVFPYIVIVLFIVFVRRLLKRIFR